MTTPGSSLEPPSFACGRRPEVSHIGRESAGPPASEQARLLGGLGDRLEPAVTCATTEHFYLQTARAATVSEANGRASIYLAALSSNLIALAFIGQMSHLGPAFYAFALILLPVIEWVGALRSSCTTSGSAQAAGSSRSRRREWWRL